MLVDALTGTEAKKVYSAEQDWSKSFAFAVTKADFEAAENYRHQSHDARWALADALYCGWEKQRYWEGTKIPRSSLGMFVVLSQIESILPDVLSAIFSDNPWFEAGPEAGTSAIDAHRVRGFMLRQMDLMKRLNNESIREVFRKATKDGLLYGLGLVELEWYDQTRVIRKITRERVPVTQTQNHPKYGPLQLPTGQWEEQLMEQETQQRIQSPSLRHRSAKDTYVDPNHTSPVLQGSRFVCTRGYMTVDELDRKRDEDDFTIPAKDKLIQLAQDKPAAMADNEKTAAEAVRGGNWNPNIDTSADPGGKRIEVISRWSAERCTWMLNREELGYNSKNRYGLIPIFNAFYIDVPGRAYGLSVADLTEGEHRFQGAVINGRVDDLALNLHGRTIKKRGTSIPNSQLRRKPGQIIEAEKPLEDVVLEKAAPILQEGYIETNASEARVQRTIGRSELIASGNQQSGGNSAGRTAAGINTMASAGAKRTIYLVETIEDTFVEPILGAWHYLNTQLLDPNLAVQIITRDGITSADPLVILNADVVFSMRASMKMRSRAALLQNFPLVTEMFLNPQLMAMLNKMGKTFDIEELFTTFLDISGYEARGRFIRPLTEQEQQALEEAAKKEQNVELVKQRERMGAMKDMQDDKQQSELVKEVAKRGLDAVLLEPDNKGK